jgi:hypothetical protein
MSRMPNTLRYLRSLAKHLVSNSYVFSTVNAQPKEKYSIYVNLSYIHNRPDEFERVLKSWLVVPTSLISSARNKLLTSR